MMDRSGTVYEALNVLGDALRGIKARKNLVLFSAGILEQGQEVTGSGVVLMTVVGLAFGPITSALMAQSTASQVLDNAATRAFRRWQFRPRTLCQGSSPGAHPRRRAFEVSLSR